MSSSSKKSCRNAHALKLCVSLFRGKQKVSNATDFALGHGDKFIGVDVIRVPGR